MRQSVNARGMRGGGEELQNEGDEKRQEVQRGERRKKLMDLERRNGARRGRQVNKTDIVTQSKTKKRYKNTAYSWIRHSYFPIQALMYHKSKQLSLLNNEHR